MTTVYGLNTAMFAGSYFTCRRILLSVIQPSEYQKLCASSAAGAIVGGFFTGLVSSIKRVPAGCVLWALAGWIGQDSMDRINAWRSGKAFVIKNNRILLSKLTPEGQREWIEYRNKLRNMEELPFPEAALLKQELLECYALEQFVLEYGLNQGRFVDPILPPLEVKINEAKEAHSRKAKPIISFNANTNDLNRPSMPTPTSVANDKPGSVNAPSNPQLSGSQDGFLAWLPVSVNQEASDSRRLLRLQNRLEDIEVTLGLRQPILDPRVIELMQREKEIEEKLKAHKLI